MPNPDSITALIAAVAAIGALGTAAFALVDATKAFGGGISNVGLHDVIDAAGRFSAALNAALEPGAWQAVARDHWINGRPRGEQKAILKALVRLGLTPETAGKLAEAAHVRAEPLVVVAGKLRNGTALDEMDVNVLGRLDVSVDAYLDAAFDRADQKYRNVSRVVAAAFAVLLALLASCATGGRIDWLDALLAGLLAVPVAPVAKDLTSAIQAASQAVKATRTAR